MDLPKPPGQAASTRNKTSRQSTAEAWPGDGVNQQPLQAAGSAEAAGWQEQEEGQAERGSPVGTQEGSPPHPAGLQRGKKGLATCSALTTNTQLCSPNPVKK